MKTYNLLHFYKEELFGIKIAIGIKNGLKFFQADFLFLLLVPRKYHPI
jgi:hypothetical protein